MRDTFVEDAHQSIIRWGQWFIGNADIGGMKYNDVRDIACEPISYHLWDTYGDQTDYPDEALFGHSSFAMDTDGFVAQLNFSYGLSFPQDKNLNRHVKIMSRLMSFLVPGEQIPFVDGRDPNEERMSWLIVSDDTSLLPIVRTSIRPVQFVQVTMLANPLLLGRTLEEIREYEEAQDED